MIVEKTCRPVEKIVHTLETFVVVTITVEEAEFLMDVGCHIGGSPRHSRRKIADELNAALWDAGVRPTDKNDIENGAGIYFAGEDE